MKHRFIIGALIVCFAVPPSLHADVIHFKNGKKIEGVVRESSADEIIVNTPGGVFSFKRDTIDRIEASSKLSNILTQARGETIRGNHSEAIFLFADALRLAQTEDEKKPILEQQETVVEKYAESLSRHDPLTQGLDDIQQIESIKTVISDPGMLAILQSAKLQMDNKTVRAHYEAGKNQRLRKNYSQAIEHYTTVRQYFPENPLAEGLDRTIVDIYFTWGEAEYRRSKKPSPIARDAFLNVLKYAPSHNMSHYYLGMMAVVDERYDEALSYLSKVDSNLLVSRDARRLRVVLSRVEQALKPKPTFAPRPVYVPPPVPTPEPSRTEKVTVWFSDAWDSVKNLVLNFREEGPESLPAILNWIWNILIVLVAFIFLWYIPMRVVLSDLPKRKVLYYNWRKIVQYTGLIGLILYFLDRLRHETPRSRCPSCSRAVDDPDLFEDFDFDKCPFCETKIKSPFTIPGLIQSKTAGLARNPKLSESFHDEALRDQMSELIYLILIQGVKIRAGDIHIIPEEEKLSVYFRVDGVITESFSTERELADLMSKCVKMTCNLNVADQRNVQEGHFRRVIMGEELNVRVSTVPQKRGEKIVLRILDKNATHAPLDRLGYRDKSLNRYQEAIHAPHGLILITGPADSGKTTLLYSSLQFINDGKRDIATVENPIEYEIDGIHQVQYNPASGMTYGAALSTILRQEPEVVLVGDIRDRDAVGIAVDVAKKRLVFTSFYAFDTSAALHRIIEIGADPEQLTKLDLCVIAQRLVRRLCPHCKKQTSASAKELRILGGSEARMLEAQPIHRPRGCRECNKTGYLGRVGIYELQVPTQAILDRVSAGANPVEIRELAIQSGLKTLAEEGVLKVLAGVTSLEEVIRVTTDDTLPD